MIGSTPATLMMSRAPEGTAHPQDEYTAAAAIHRSPRRRPQGGLAGGVHTRIHSGPRRGSIEATAPCGDAEGEVPCSELHATAPCDERRESSPPKRQAAIVVPVPRRWHGFWSAAPTRGTRVRGWTTMTIDSLSAVYLQE